jgi:hypothetical protein
VETHPPSPRNGRPLACRRAGRPARRKRARTADWHGKARASRKVVSRFRAAGRPSSTSGGTPDATAQGNTSPRLNDFASIIYNGRRETHDVSSCGETNHTASESNQGRKSKLWETDHRNPTRRSSHRNSPRPTVPHKRKSRPWPPSRLQIKSNHCRCLF